MADDKSEEFSLDSLSSDSEGLSITSKESNNFFEDATNTIKQGFAAFRYLDQASMENEPFWHDHKFGKFEHFSALWGAYGECWGVLDIATAGIPRTLFYLSGEFVEWLSPSKQIDSESNDNNGITVSKVIRGILSGFYLQRLVGYLLTVLSLPLIGLIEYLYPYKGVSTYGDPDDEASAIIIHNNLLLGKKRRQAFRQFILNPSTWVIGFLLTFGISLIIQAFNAAVFAEAVMPLTIIQMVFTSAASLMLVGLVVAVACWAVSAIYQHLKPFQPSPLGKAKEKAKYIEENDLQNYVNEFFSHKWLAGVSITVGALCVLTVVILTVGFLTDGFGVFLGSFDFMAAVFNAIGGGFTAGMQSISHLPGLTSLGSISEPALQLIGQIATVSILALTAIFLPDGIRRIVQARLPKVVIVTAIISFEGIAQDEELTYQLGDKFEIHDMPTTAGWIRVTSLKNGVTGFIHISNTNYYEVTGAYCRKQQVDGTDPFGEDRSDLDLSQEGPFHCTHLATATVRIAGDLIYSEGDHLEFLQGNADGTYKMRNTDGEELEVDSEHTQLVVDSLNFTDEQYIVHEEKNGMLTVTELGGNQTLRSVINITGTNYTELKSEIAQKMAIGSGHNPSPVPTTGNRGGTEQQPIYPKYQAERDYEAEDGDELSFVKGDIFEILVQQTMHSGWCTARNAIGKIGYVMLDCLEEVKSQKNEFN